MEIEVGEAAGKRSISLMNWKEDKELPVNPIFGPVPSRRLGMSLGVDLCPMKVCSYDCIYCELGRTTYKTIERREYVPKSRVIKALEIYFMERKSDGLDYVTFAGSGEPTLNSSLGAVIRKVKKLTNTPVAVLTNGSLLLDPKVRSELAPADLVIPSLDAATRECFRKINRPVLKVKVEDVIEGVRLFSREFHNEIWLEILFVEGVNDHSSEVEKLVEHVDEIQPSKVQISTVVRPPGVGHAPPVNADRLQKIASSFKGCVEIVSEFDRKVIPAYSEKRVDEIKAMLRIRPATLEDISASLGIHRNEVVKYLEQVCKDHTIRQTEFLGKIYFTMDR